MEIDFEYLTQVFFIVWFLTTVPIKLLIDEFQLIVYSDEIHKRENEIERDGHFFGKKYSKDIAKYEYMEGRYYSKFTYSLLKNLDLCFLVKNPNEVINHLDEVEFKKNKINKNILNLNALGKKILNDNYNEVLKYI